MKVREQLLELREAIDGMSANYRNRLGFCPLELINRLLAERPYEPGELITAFDGLYEATFIAMHHENTEKLWAIIKSHDRPTLFDARDCRPIPRTRTLEVPEEIIEAAVKGTYVAGEKERAKVCKWLANPENWEDEE